MRKSQVQLKLRILTHSPCRLSSTPLAPLKLADLPTKVSQPRYVDHVFYLFLDENSKLEIRIQLHAVRDGFNLKIVDACAGAVRATL